MKYNTTPFTNIDSEIFIGKYDGEDYSIESGEKRYFPTFLSEHFFKTLSEKLMDKKEKQSSNIEASLEKMRAEILEKEIETIAPEKPRTTKDEVIEHERNFDEMLENEKREIEAKKIQAIKITNY